MVRTYWKGNISVGVLSVPVSLVKATDSEYRASPFKLYDGNGNKVISPRCVRTETGDLKELQPQEIKQGFETENGLLLFEKEEIKAIQSRTTTELKILGTTIMLPDELRTGDKYYIVPQEQKKGKERFYAGLKQFALLKEWIRGDDGINLLGKFTDRSREHLVSVHLTPHNEIVMEKLFYTQEIREVEYPKLPDLSEQERELAKTFLNKVLNNGFDFFAQKDEYVEKVQALVTAKVAGKPIELQAIEQKESNDVMALLKEAVAESG